MNAHTPINPGPHPGGDFTSSWTPVGVRAGEVRAVGEIDMATAPLLAQSLQAAIDAAPLTVLFMGEVTFIDCSGLHVILAASSAARNVARRLVVVEMRAQVQAVFAMTGTDSTLDILDESPVGPGSSATSTADTSQEPPDTPVNAAGLTARVMAVPTPQLWMQIGDGGVRHAWAPESMRASTLPGGTVEVYLDESGEVNGWWDRASGLAVNLRHLDHTAPPAAGDPMVCQGPCGLVRHAPAAALLQEHDERCLTRAGRLALG